MSYEKCDNCIHFEIIEAPLFDDQGRPDGIAPEPFCAINQKCVHNRS